MPRARSSASGCRRCSGAPLRYITLQEAGEERRGAGQGLLTLCVSIGQLSGSAVVGGIVGSAADELGGYRHALLAVGVACALALVLSAALRGRVSYRPHGRRRLSADGACELDARSLDCPVDPVRRLRAARRGGRCRGRGRRRSDPLRRDGQPLRAESHDRPAGVRGAAQARRDGADRRAPDGQARRPDHPRLRGRRRELHQHPSRSDRARRSLAAADSRARLPRRPRVQSGDAARLARLTCSTSSISC